MEKNTNTNQSEKKHNKVVSWFLGLPKWGKILLIAGSAGGIATAITVPVVVLNNKGNNVTVTETEFKDAINNFKAASVGDSDDNRNYYSTFKGVYTGYSKESGTSIYSFDTNIMFEKNFIKQTEKVSITSITEEGKSTVTTNKEINSNYMGNGIGHDIEIDKDTGATSVEIKDYGQFDYLCNLPYFDFDYNSLSFKDGSYSGNFSINDMTIPLSITFNNDKKISKVVCCAKNLDLGKDKCDLDVTFDISNYGTTSTGLKSSDFERKTIEYDGTSIDENLEKDFSKRKVIVVKSSANVIKKATLSLKPNTKGYPRFLNIMCNGYDIGIKDGRVWDESSVDLSNAKDETPVGDNVYICTEKSNTEVSEDVHFKISEVK